MLFLFDYLFTSFIIKKGFEETWIYTHISVFLFPSKIRKQENDVEAESEEV